MPRKQLSTRSYAKTYVRAAAKSIQVQPKKYDPPRKIRHVK